MGKYSKKLLSRVKANQVKKKLNETGDFDEICNHLEEIGLGDFVHRDEDIELMQPERLEIGVELSRCIDMIQQQLKKGKISQGQYDFREVIYFERWKLALELFDLEKGLNQYE